MPPCALARPVGRLAIGSEKNRATARFFLAGSHTKLLGNLLYLSQLLGY